MMRYLNYLEVTQLWYLDTVVRLLRPTEGQDLLALIYCKGHLGNTVSQSRDFERSTVVLGV